MGVSLNQEDVLVSIMMQGLRSRGCDPSVCRRGRQWRAHVNRAGNFWSDAQTRSAALRVAIKRWAYAGCPKEGGAP